ncbi:MAG: transketolase family protein [Alicyclobacillus sp.]|nr:transketolase family protein [Alicyclobacillus sp.]
MSHSTEQQLSLRDAYGSLIVQMGKEEPRLVVLDADLSKSTRTDGFHRNFPSRYLNVGIAEQNMVGVAAGIALAGGIPFVNTFASFLTRRAADQIAISVAYPNLNVKFFGFHAGINLGEDGATQQSIEDLGIMRSIPGIRVYAPVDSEDLNRVLHEVLAIEGPTYVRLARFPSPVLTKGIESTDIRDGYYILRRGGDVTVVSSGTILAQVVHAVEELDKHGVQVEVIAVSRIKPFPPSLVEYLIRGGRTRLLVVEEHNIRGGLADEISAAFDEAGVWHVIKRIGIPDRFGESGSPQALLEKFGLSGDRLVDSVKNYLNQYGRGGNEYVTS